MEEIRGHSVLILGYGKEGRSVHRYLNRNYPGIEIGIADIKPVRPDGGGKVTLHTGKNYLRSVFGYDTIVRSPGVSSKLTQLRRAGQTGKHITSATNIFFAVRSGKVIGVTGTKGKSTTASLTAEILGKRYQDVRLLGNIGRPALDHLSEADRNTIFVSELSSFQLEDLCYSPEIAVLLHIFPEHMDRYDSLNEYIAAKARIVEAQTGNNYVVYSPDAEFCAAIAAKSKARKYRYSLSRGDRIQCYIRDDSVFVAEDAKADVRVLPLTESPLLGRANRLNIAAAVSVGNILGVAVDDIARAIAKFQPLPHRLEYVGEFKGIRFYNDSLATVPQATMHALEALGSEVETLITGGYDRGVDYSQLGEYLSESRIGTLVLFPTTGAKIWQALSRKRKKLPEKYTVDNMRKAVEIAFNKTEKGKICLLSPAAASFNLFRDYRERGEQFKQLVIEYGQK